MSTNKLVKKIKNEVKSPTFKNIIEKIEDQFFQIFEHIGEIDDIIQKVIDKIIEYKQPKIILDHYLILFRIKDEYNEDFSSGFFNKLFLKLYLRFPRTIIALFIESSNFQFLRYFSSYVFNYIEISKDNTIQIALSKLYNLIILLFSIQLNKDYKTVQSTNYSLNEQPIISDVALYIPSIQDVDDECFKITRKNISYKLFGTFCCKSYKEYDNMIEILKFNITVFQKKKSTYIFENDMDIDSAKKCCFKLFHKNFLLDIKE